MADCPLVLSLFPGIGLLDMAFEQEGFCVVRGPDLLWGGDIHRFHPPAGKFEGVIGGPPCQAFSRLAHIVALNRSRCGDETKYLPAENMIPEFERVIRLVQPRWFLVENVPDAPNPVIENFYVVARLLNNRWLGETQNRLRKFVWGRVTGSSFALHLPIEVEALEPAQYDYAVCAAGGNGVPVKVGGSGKIKRLPKASAHRSVSEMARLQGLPDGFLVGAPFTAQGKRHVIGNGVPLPMGRAVAKAVKRAMGYQL